RTATITDRSRAFWHAGAPLRRMDEPVAHLRLYSHRESRLPPASPPARACRAGACPAAARAEGNGRAAGRGDGPAGAGKPRLARSGDESEAGLARLLAESRRCRRGDADRLDPAGGRKSRGAPLPRPRAAAD